ncbi:phage tail assembly chaperone G [Bacillus sp. CGMCC 1.60114]|uniref:phage tail assembly chaperone G n=1 Tax=unclassified Bacillus (in: firmicutes) TaxID=185979 RepID=UPI003627E5B7
MKITLQTPECEKDFFLPEHIPGSMTFEASRLIPELEKDFVPEDMIKKAADFVCRLYGNKFTVDEFIDGTHVWFLTITIYSVCATVLGRLEEALKMMNKVEESKKKMMEQIRNPKRKKSATVK